MYRSRSRAFDRYPETPWADIQSFDSSTPQRRGGAGELTMPTDVKGVVFGEMVVLKSRFMER